MMWSIEKQPKTKEEFFGSTFMLFDNFIKAYYTNPLSKAVIFHGPSGTGKTRLATLYAELKNWDIYLSDGSTPRNLDEVHQIYKQGLTGDKKIIIIDDCESLPKASSRFLAKKIKDFVHPVVMICNNKYMLIPELRNNFWEIQFDEPNTFDLEYFFEEFCEKHNIKISNSNKKKIIKNSHSYRGIVNNIQIFIETGLLLKEYEGFGDKEKEIRADLRGIPTTIKDEELFTWVASNSKNYSINDECNLLIGCAKNGKVIGYATRYLSRFVKLDKRLRLFSMRNPNKKQKTSKKKGKKAKPVKELKQKIKKVEEVKTDSVLDWI